MYNHLLKNKRTTPTRVMNQKLPCAVSSNKNGAGVKWLILELENTTGDRGLAALFDASGKFELKEDIQTQDGITIRAINTSYAGVLNDLASGEQYCFDRTEIEVISGSNLQLENPWLIKEDKRFTNGNSLVQEIYPSTYKDAYQQQANRLTVFDPYSITRQRVMETQVEANTKVVLRMRLSAALTNG